MHTQAQAVSLAAYGAYHAHSCLSIESNAPYDGM